MEWQQNTHLVSYVELYLAMQIIEIFFCYQMSN